MGYKKLCNATKFSLRLVRSSGFHLGKKMMTTSSIQPLKANKTARLTTTLEYQCNLLLVKKWWRMSNKGLVMISSGPTPTCEYEGGWLNKTRIDNHHTLTHRFVDYRGKVLLPVPFMKRKKGGSQIWCLGRCGRKKTQFSSSTIASDPCACTWEQWIKTREFNMNSKCLKSSSKTKTPVSHENITMQKATVTFTLERIFGIAIKVT